MANGRTRVVYKYVNMQGVVDFSLQTLRANSPIGSGDDPHIGLYRASHLVFLNGRVVENVSAWKPGDEVEIGNPVPYSRLIEIGILRMRIPGSDHVYQKSEAIIRSKYGAVVAIKFAFMPIRFESQSAARTFRKIEGKDRDTRASSLRQQPSLIITALQ